MIKVFACSINLLKELREDENEQPLDQPAPLVLALSNRAGSPVDVAQLQSVSLEARRKNAVD
jgi:hypothetical protein